MRVLIKENYEKCSVWAANYIAYKINKFRPTKEKPFVMGLPTGSSPLGIYQKLIEMNKNGTLSFENVVTFNTNEYLGLSSNHPQSYAYFMWENFFKHINIKKENINLLNGMTKDFAKECASYEERMKKFGKIHLFLGGVGTDGHIAFNEPGSSLSARTRIKKLTSETIESNSRFFDNDISKVPTHALTVGIGTIMDSEEVMIIASGKNKALAISKGIEGSINHMWTISALQMHQHPIIVIDEDAASEMNLEIVEYFKDLEKDNY